MPKWVSGPHGEKAWEKAKKAAEEQYPGLEKKDSEKFYAIVTTIYKKVCSNKDWNCGIGESVVRSSFEMRPLIERLMSIGNPQMRKLAAYDMVSVARNFAGEMAYKLANKSDPCGELAAIDPNVKRTGKKMVEAIKEFVNAVSDSENYIDITQGNKLRVK